MDNSPFLSRCTADAINNAASQLISGHLVAFPTETVYGLGADASNADAVKRIYEVKARPTDHPLIVHISSMNLLQFWASEIPHYAIKLARDFWPGPMTLVLKRTPEAKDFITGGQDSVAVRVPDESVALALLRSFESMGGKGVAAPSANRFGQVSPTSSQDVYVELGEYLSDGDLIIDGGKCAIGIESTIIDCTQRAPRILRPGAITNEMIGNSLGIKISGENVYQNIKFSGSFDRHYAPRAKVILDQLPTKGQGFLAISDIETPEGVIRVGKPSDILEFARCLYASLRSADNLGLSEVIIYQPVNKGLGIAIRNRLKKASAGK